MTCGQYEKGVKVGEHVVLSGAGVTNKEVVELGDDGQEKKRRKID